MKYCKRCGKEHERKKSEYCCSKCGRKFSEERKAQLSLARKKYLKDNPDKHTWKNRSNKSVPCERVKEYLKNNNILFVEEWNPLDDRFFSIDIAFPDIKLGLEINGNQHYDSNGNLKEYYQERHDLIEKEGWKLIELHYSSCYNEKLILEILDIKEQPDYSEFFLKKKVNILPKSLGVGVKNRMNGDRKWEGYIDKVLNSGIDFSKFGWVKQVANILNITQQQVNRWMKRHLKDFYEKECYKRKTGVVSQRSSKPSLTE